MIVSYRFNDVLHPSREVELIALADISVELEIGDMHIGPVRKGEKMVVPLVVAEKLIEKELCKLDETALPTLTDVHKFAWFEARSLELQPLEKDFYFKVKLLIKSISQEIKRDSSPELLRKLELVKSSFYDLVKSRVQKIVELAIARPTVDRTIIDKLTLEERELYIKLCDVVGEWFSSLRKFIER
ncbi:MAG: hypothetical protein DRJ32_00140 [Thermoprotei archaeon]|nr:MAG: hypothetical protein DRJ32_00140 [Thermoprotei archaeon]